MGAPVRIASLHRFVGDVVAVVVAVVVAIIIIVVVVAVVAAAATTGAIVVAVIIVVIVAAAVAVVYNIACDLISRSLLSIHGRFPRVGPGTTTIAAGKTGLSAKSTSKSQKCFRL